MKNEKLRKEIGEFWDKKTKKEKEEFRNLKENRGKKVGRKEYIDGFLKALTIKENKKLTNQFKKGLKDLKSGRIRRVA